MGLAELLKGLGDEQVVIPHVENGIASDTWPEQYNIPVDTSVYYGSLDEDGNLIETGHDGYFHPSTHPTMSELELYYEFHPEHDVALPKRTFSLAAMWSMTMGTAAHSVIQTQLDMRSLLVRGSSEWSQVSSSKPWVRGKHPEKNPVEWEYINSRHNVRGRADGILDLPVHGQMVLEFKTANQRHFKFMDAPFPKWEIQGCLAADAYGLDEIVVVVLEMAYPWNMKEFRVKRRDSIVEPVYEKFDRVREAIQRDIPPRCIHQLDSKEYRQCRASHLCYPMEG